MVIHWQYEVANDIAKYSSCQAHMIRPAYPFDYSCTHAQGQRYRLVSFFMSQVSISKKLNLPPPSRSWNVPIANIKHTIYGTFRGTFSDLRYLKDSDG